MNGGEQLLDARIGDPVPERLRLAAEGDDVLLAHLGEVLGQGRLGDSNRLGERGDIGLAPLDELAKNHQPPLVGKRAQQFGHPGGLTLEALKVKRCRVHGTYPLGLAYLASSYILSSTRLKRVRKEKHHV